MKVAYYGFDGEEIDRDQWSALFEDAEGRRIGYDELPNGYTVSTVWLGLDHSFGDGPPLIYETMVFKTGSHSDEDMLRYPTRGEAAEGHANMVERWGKA
jgi:hypothetical protein